MNNPKLLKDRSKSYQYQRPRTNETVHGEKRNRNPERGTFESETGSQTN